ncbi:MAG: DNA-binding protein [Proteobacteria bacterium]|nr:DNA-binding protein [Pseudomonadota bacterium]
MSFKDTLTPLSTLEPKEKNTFLNSITLTDFIAQYCDSYLNNNNSFSTKGGLYPLLISEIDRSLFQKVLEHTKGNQSQTADILGINRNTLRKKLKNLGFNDEQK